MEKKSELYFDHQSLVNTVGSFQKHLRKEKGYELVLFAGVDEIVVPDPNVYAGGLTQYLSTLSNVRNGTFKRKDCQ